MRSTYIFYLAAIFFLFTACESGSTEASSSSNTSDTEAKTTGPETHEEPKESNDPIEEPVSTDPPGDWSILLEPPTLGIMDGQTTHEQLVQALGEAARLGDVHLGEGETAPGTILYPGTPEEVQIMWKDAAMTVAQDANIGGSSSKWTFNGEPILGMTVQDIERINEGPFSLAGCCWDYEGGVLDWQGGNFEKWGGIGISFAYGGKASGHEDVLGDVEVSSENPVFDEFADDVTVAQVIIFFDRD